MKISYDSVGQLCVTAKNPDKDSAGQLCAYYQSDSVSLCEEDDPIHGMIVAARDGEATIAVSGFVTVKYTGTAPSVGFCALAAADSTTVKVLTGAREYLVVRVDTTAGTVTFKL